MSFFYGEVSLILNTWVYRKIHAVEPFSKCRVLHVLLCQLVMSKKCQLIDVTEPVTSNPLASLDWELCVLCQRETVEPLQCPAA